MENVVLFGVSLSTWLTALIVVVLIVIALKITKKAIKVALFIGAVAFVALKVLGGGI